MLGDSGVDHDGSPIIFSRGSRGCPVEMAGLRCLGSHLDSISLQLCLQPSLSGGAAPGLPLPTCSDGEHHQQQQEEEEEQQQLQASCPLGSQRQPFACFGDFVGCLRGLLEAAVQAGPPGCRLGAIAKQLLQLLEDELLLLGGRVPQVQECRPEGGQVSGMDSLHSRHGPVCETQPPAAEAALGGGVGTPLAQEPQLGCAPVGEEGAWRALGLQGVAAAGQDARGAAAVATGTAAEPVTGGAVDDMLIDHTSRKCDDINHPAPEGSRLCSAVSAACLGWSAVQDGLGDARNAAVEGKRGPQSSGLDSSLLKRARIATIEASVSRQESPWPLEGCAALMRDKAPLAAPLVSASTVAASQIFISRGTVPADLGCQEGSPAVAAAAAEEAEESCIAPETWASQPIDQAQPQSCVELPAGSQPSWLSNADSSSRLDKKAQAIARVQAFYGTLKSSLEMSSKHGLEESLGRDGLQGGSQGKERSQSPCCCGVPACTLGWHGSHAPPATGGGLAAEYGAYCSVEVQANHMRQPPYVAKQIVLGALPSRNPAVPAVYGKGCHVSLPGRDVCALGTAPAAAAAYVLPQPSQQLQQTKQPFPQQKQQQQRLQLLGTEGAVGHGEAGLASDDLLLALGEQSNAGLEASI
jgi:hypothetical protein